MPTFKSRYLVIAAAILLIIVVAAPVPQRSIGMQVLHDFGHAPIFGIVAILVLLWLRDHAIVRSTAVQYALAFVASVVLGVAVEIVQVPLGRDASWLDVRSDVLGAFGFLALFACVDTRVDRRSARIASAALGALVLAIHSWPLLRAAAMYAQRNSTFPVLFDARQSYADYFLEYFEATGDHVALPSGYARQAGEKALLLHLGHHWSPTFAITESVADWRAYRSLAIDLTNDSALPLALKIGVRDRSYDELQENGFVRFVTLAPKTRVTLRIGLDEIARELDLREMDSVVLFDRHAKSAREVYVSRVWLE